jgi:hypothetical protein
MVRGAPGSKLPRHACLLVSPSGQLDEADIRGHVHLAQKWHGANKTKACIAQAFDLIGGEEEDRIANVPYMDGESFQIMA